MGREITVFRDMKAQVLGMKPVEISSPEDASRDVMLRILEAGSIQDVLAPVQIAGWADYLGQDVILESMKLNASTFEEGPPAYGVFELTVLASGERVTVTSGASNVLAQAIAIGELGGFPIKVRLIEAGKPTAAGFRPQWLEAVTDAA